MKILIADSSPQITERLRCMLKKEHKSIIIYAADNYETALQVFIENKPTVVLLDLKSHPKETLELLRAIKKTGQETVVIILSILISIEVRDQCKLLGATIFLDKFLEFEKIPGIISGIDEKLNDI